MAFHVLDRTENASGWLLTVILTPLCIFATVLRFMATKRSGRTFGWEDFWALLGLIFYIPYAVYMLMLLTEANGRSALMFIKQEPKEWITVAKYGLMMNALFGFQQTFVKYSLLALYHRTFWINPTFVKMVWVIAVIQGMWGIVVLLCHIFTCVPVRKSWYPQVPGTCIDLNLFFSITEPINSVIDFVMAGMAIFILWKLSFHRNTRRVWGFTFLFALGAFSGIIGIIKTVEAQGSAKRNYHSVTWNLVQMATSIICCCAPIYRSIMPRFSFFDSLGSWTSQIFRSTGSRSKTSVHTGGKSTHSMRSKGSPKGSAGYQERSAEFNKHGAPWEEIGEGASDREVAWTEIMVNDEGRSERDGIPMQTVKVGRTVEVVES